MQFRQIAVPIAAAFAVIGCADDRPAGNDAPAGAAARRQVLAPIEAAEVIVRESFPPQYAVQVTSGLPSGCASFDRIDLARDGTVVELTVWNTVPADPAIACTMIYGTAVNTASIGGDFESGREYNVRINGEIRARFTAQ